MPTNSGFSQCRWCFCSASCEAIAYSAAASGANPLDLLLLRVLLRRRLMSRLLLLVRPQQVLLLLSVRLLLTPFLFLCRVSRLRCLNRPFLRLLRQRRVLRVRLSLNV